MKILNVLSQAFRTTVEEQDETILWLVQSMMSKAKASSDNVMSLLLSGHAVYYAFQNQPQPALTLGDWQQSQPANIKRDIQQMLDARISIYLVYEDLWDRGLDMLPVPAGIDIVNRNEIPALYEYADHIWHW